MDYIKSYKDTLETPACSKEFGVGPFRVYELPPLKIGRVPRTIFYADDTFGSNVWEYSDSYTAEYWGWIKPKQYVDEYAGFQAVDPQKCERIIGVFVRGHGDRGAKNYNSIIEYNNQYYFVILHERRSNYWLDVQTVAPYRSKEMKICNWTPIAPTPNSSTQGRK